MSWTKKVSVAQKNSKTASGRATAGCLPRHTKQRIQQFLQTAASTTCIQKQSKTAGRAMAGGPGACQLGHIKQQFLLAKQPAQHPKKSKTASGRAMAGAGGGACSRGTRSTEAATFLQSSCMAQCPIFFLKRPPAGQWLGLGAVLAPAAHEAWKQQHSCKAAAYGARPGNG